MPVCAALPVESRKEAAGSQQHGAFREDSASIIHPLKVVFGDGGHTDGTRRTIQELVAISAKNRETRISKHTSDHDIHMTETPNNWENMQTPPGKDPTLNPTLNFFLTSAAPCCPGQLFMNFSHGQM